MGKLSLPFYSQPFYRYIFLQGLLSINLLLLCISSMTDPDATHTMRNRLVLCNRTKVSDVDCEAVSRSLGKMRIREMIIWSHHFTLGVLSSFSVSILILSWATHAKTWPRLERQRVVFWCAPFISCLILLIQVFLALFNFMIIRVVYLWMSVMAAALVIWDGFHYSASLYEFVPESTQPSETPPSKRSPVKPPTPINSDRPTKTTVPKNPAPPMATVAPVKS